MPAHAPEKVLQQPLACTTLYLVSAVEVEDCEAGWRR